jgi:hypothetical protein
MSEKHHGMQLAGSGIAKKAETPFPKGSTDF